MASFFMRAGFDGMALTIVAGWAGNLLPVLALLIPTLYYAVLLSKEWPPACKTCNRLWLYIKSLCIDIDNPPTPPTKENVP